MEKINLKMEKYLYLFSREDILLYWIVGFEYIARDL